MKSPFKASDPEQRAMEFAPGLLHIPTITGKIKLGITLLFAATIVACAGIPSAKSSSWKEEVQLQDGNKIIVSRSVVRGGRHEPFQQSPIYSQDLSFVIPTTNEKVTWEDKFSEDIGSANFLPMMLEIDQGIAYLVVNPMGCLSYNKWGRPNPPYIVFQYQDKAWSRISLEELPEAFKMPNLIFSSPDETAKKLDQRIVSSETIKALYAGYSQLEYKTVLRGPIKVGCEALVPYGKGGWLGLDWFSDQPNYESCSELCNTKKVSPQNCPCSELFYRNKL